MPVVPWLRLQSRLEGLPVEQLDRHMAQDVAEELGLEYKMVRWQQDLSAAGKLTSHLALIYCSSSVRPAGLFQGLLQVTKGRVRTCNNKS